MTDEIRALQNSSDRLVQLVEPLGAAVENPAYPSEWTIADVVSHLGSGSVIFERRVDDLLAGRTTPDGFNEEVWAEWNNKSPQEKVREGLAAIRAYTRRLATVTPEQRASFKMPMGPLELGWGQLIQMRLNEQLVHEWDIAVALDPTARLAQDGTDLTIDDLGLIARFTGKASGAPRTVIVSTHAPERMFSVTITEDHVDFAPTQAGQPTLTMPAEAFIRLIYGRLDTEHTPHEVVDGGDSLEGLRKVFPGP
jgi:uncharacterized protein (TIGR03083 family)